MSTSCDHHTFAQELLLTVRTGARQRVNAIKPSRHKKGKSMNSCLCAYNNLNILLMYGFKDILYMSIPIHCGYFIVYY
jgi:hypothetical protein